MRIIGGKAGGRRLQTPSRGAAKDWNQRIRPTADRAREALFNIIGSEVSEAVVLDLYAGTGALGLEALSRSARLAVFVDSSRAALQIIDRNIALCEFADRAIVFREELSRGLGFLAKKLPGTVFSLVFVDPPYRKGLSERTLTELAAAALLAAGALVVVEDDAGVRLPSRVGELVIEDQRHYGDTGLWFYRLQ